MYEPNESLSERIERKGFVTGTFIQDVRSPFVIQVAANAGLDYVLLDGEHGAFSEESMADLIKMARAMGVMPLVRVIGPEYCNLCPRLDAGAQGLVIPRIRTAEEVRDAVSCVMYPPEGVRGAVMLKGQSDYVPIDMAEFMKRHNRTPVIIPQVETREAVENLDAILDVHGVAAVFIGPGDLSIAYDWPGQRTHPDLISIMDSVLEKSKKKGIPCSILAGNNQEAASWRDKGMKILCVGSEASLLAAAYNKIDSDLR
jgi:2-keto-3-deoxy-L-rhamnonate aldolase RhmA